ncbi:hypothetical protein J4212_01290 [Candidatus Woesearchaeota archaeon]|nr:hypothetical protein [Candidatus Woesearchaeota archaeon]
MAKEEKTKESKDMPPCCAGCIRWERFGKKCWYFWENKKECTMWTSDVNEMAAQDSSSLL